MERIKMTVVKIRELSEEELPGFKETREGVALRNHELSSASGELIVRVTNFGPAIVELLARGREPDSVENIVLGYPNITGYEKNDSYQGVIAVGPCANRISGGRFRIHDESLRPTGMWANLDKGDNGNCLHSGSNGWSTKVWDVEDVKDTREEVAVTYHLANANEDTGFPGHVDAYVKLALFRGNRLVFEYSATTDVPTIINPVQHLYFNLDGVINCTEVRNTIGGHTLVMDADSYLVADKKLIPIAIAEVGGTRYDFRERQTRIGEHFEDGKGIDTCFVFSESIRDKSSGRVRDKGREAIERATLYSPESGREVKIASTERAMQVYTSEGLGKPFIRRGAICLELQELVDAVNQYERFGLLPRQIFTTPKNPYYQKTVMTFGHR